MSKTNPNPPQRRGRRYPAPQKSTPKKSDPRDLALKKWAETGLTEEDAALLGMDFLEATETAEQHPSFNAVPSIRINYYTADGRPMRDYPKSEPFFRIRYLKILNDFSHLDARPVRYVQPPNTMPVAYFPQNQPDWPDIIGDPDRPIILTEGELKAAKACKEGFPTIGLGGVYNWRAYKSGITFIPSLEEIAWHKRNVYICFDSDYRTNPMVCAALRDLADELVERGAFVFLVSLPNADGAAKTGLDDFLVYHGNQGAEQFRHLLHTATPFGLSRVLWELNDRYVYVRNPGVVVCPATDFHKSSPASFKEHLESALRYQEAEIRKDGTIGYRPTAASAAWLKWPLRNEAERLTYQPGKAQSVPVSEHHAPLLNIWPGWGCEPREGNVEPWLRLVDHIFTDAEPEAKRWFLQWCAYPIQHPGVKMFTAAVVHGIKQGTGKSLIGYSLGRIYGRNFAEINQQMLHGDFNDWAEAKQFIMGDDVTGTNKRQDADALKKMITQKELRVNVKFIPAYTVPDCINYYFTSQHADSFFLEDDDRRFFVHEVTAGRLPEAFYKSYMTWLDNGGASHLFHWLLNHDLEGFNPFASAVRTAAKDRMINIGRSDLGSWVRQMLATPDHVLKVGTKSYDKDIITTSQLLAYYDPDGRTGTTANGIARELSRAGVHQVRNGQPIRLSDGSQARYVIIRNVDYWRTAERGMIIDHLEGNLQRTDVEKNRSKKSRLRRKSD